MIRTLLRKFRFVKALEARIETLEKQLDSEKCLVASQDRYIRNLEQLKDFDQDRIAALEKKVDELQRKLDGRYPE